MRLRLPVGSDAAIRRNDTCRPAASPGRNLARTAGHAWAGSVGALDVQFQEVGRTRDARVVVADGPLAQPGELGLGALTPIEAGLDQPTQVLLDGALVLGGRWHDAGVRDTPPSSNA